MPRQDYEVVMGLEVHAELATKTKIFCSCPTKFGAEPNTQVCPICMAMPGTLPKLNEKVVEYAVRAGLATNCTISRDSKNDRKNYFYPDTPRAYQISQFDKPLCEHGYIEIETSQGNYVITGKYYSSPFNFYDRAGIEIKGTMTNAGERDAFVASYSDTGVYQWSQTIGETNNQDAPDLTEYSAGIAVASNSSESARISLYSLAGSSIKRAFSIGSGSVSKITSLDTSADGNIIAGVNYTGKEFDAGIYQVTSTGTSTRIYELTGTYDEYVSDVQVTSDGGILFGGWYYSKYTAGTDGTTFDEELGDNACDGYVIKLNSKNEVEYSSRLYGDDYDGVTTVTETKNGAFLLSNK